MKTSLCAIYSAIAVVLAAPTLCAETPAIFVDKSSAGWHYLHITDGEPPAGKDNRRFNNNWYGQTVANYRGNSNYPGPKFQPDGKAPFHYGGVDGLKGGTKLEVPPSGKRFTSYFLKPFDGGKEGSEHIAIDMLCDDGAFIYLNGELIARHNVTGQDNYKTLATRFGDEKNFVPIELIGEPKVQPGKNLLAISLHNNKATSSDLGFDIVLSNREGDQVITPTINRGPYLQAGSPTSATVRWRTNFAGSSVVKYGTAPDQLDQLAEIKEPTREHIVTINGLQPAVRYFYTVESRGGENFISSEASVNAYFQTHPQAGSKVDTRIWVIGDSGTTSKQKMDVYKSYLQRSAGQHTDAWLMLGDNAYNKGTDQEFQRAVFNAYPELLQNTFLWSCIGNHETYSDGGKTYLNVHTFPTKGESGGVASGSELYFSFDHGNIHFISIDSQSKENWQDKPGTGGMIDWLEQDLQATDKDWIVAFFHHGPYTKGSHDSDREPQHIAMRNYVTPLLEKYGTDLVLSGHSHCYERSMLVNGHHSKMDPSIDSKSATFTKDMLVDAGNGSTLGGVDAEGNFLNDASKGNGAYQKETNGGDKEVKGTVYSIVGASGKLSRWTDRSDDIVNPNPHPVFIVNLRVMGSMIIDVKNNQLHAQYIDEKNQVRDDFTIVKKGLK